MQVKIIQPICYIIYIVWQNSVNENYFQLKVKISVYFVCKNFEILDKV